jgi:hypothetical protein
MDSTPVRFAHSRRKVRKENRGQEQLFFNTAIFAELINQKD